MHTCVPDNGCGGGAAPDSQPPDAAEEILELAKEREEEARIMGMY